MKAALSSDRASNLDQLEADEFDVVVVGGGITGAGIARDATARGLRVALVEADDFASGTSSRSSKLIHGGLRYLASGEVDLVRKTARERQAVHAMAPHLAEPCYMVVPARNLAGATKFRAGIGTYEKLGAIGDADRHQNWGVDEIAQHEPLLRTDTYTRAVAYREYLTDDARLVLGVLRAAVRDGATAASRLPMVGVLHEAGKVTGVVCRCATTGREVRVRARVVVNAAGPWVEDVARMEIDGVAPGAKPATHLHLSKGIHVVLERARLPVNHLVICNAEDRRSIFVIPRGEVVYVGTTDTSYYGSRPLWPEIERADVDYLLAPLGRYFDVEPPTPDDVIAAWAGVRPLVAEPGKSAKEISRKDEIVSGPGGMLSIAGGKLTGFRKMAEDIVELVGRQLGVTLSDGPGTAPIPGGEPVPLAEDPLARRLTRLYGSEAQQVISLGADPLVKGVPAVEGEVDWAIDVEAAVTLEDVVYRRTRVAWYLPTHRNELADAMARRMATKLGWDDARTIAELERVQHLFADELAFKETR
ncbi:MAG: glycerol-3-phosphate dehydrogenase/oxidase [Acidimicrobiales bacterium]|nr:glycerol-3-phosphate dehydrogenase/oxidase [Acidimicrobiales bacterium]